MYPQLPTKLQLMMFLTVSIRPIHDHDRLFVGSGGGSFGEQWIPPKGAINTEKQFYVMATSCMRMNKAVVIFMQQHAQEFIDWCYKGFYVPIYQISFVGQMAFY